ncbi:MAG: helix-turn-helix transcriptional regulator [Clostridia bacterium]|nr:helix-turn-helix transcriptional regulator [Clostridia bacterium]
MNENVKFHAAGKFTSRGEWIHGSISVPTTEIIIVTDGCVKLEENGIRYDLTPGAVLFLDSDTPHRGYEPTLERVSFYWIHMKGYDCHADSAPEKHFTLREPYHVSILCRQLLHYNTIGSDSEITSSLLRVLLHELSLQSRGDDESSNALARRINEWIRINADRSITAPDVALKFGYNEDYISRLLKQHYGIGLKAQIDGHRLRLIKRYLLESDLTLAEIADTVGFSDYKLFLKFFKYHAGMTPGEFKRIYYAIHTNNR